MDLLVLFIGSASIGLLAYGAVRFVPRFFPNSFSTGSERHNPEQQAMCVAPAVKNYDYNTIGLTTEQANKAFVQLPKVTQDLIARVYADTQNERVREVVEVEN